MALVHCRRPGGDEKNHALHVPGEDSSLALLVGQGLNHIDGTAKGFCTETEQFETQSGQSTGQFVEFRLLEITSAASLRESLRISATASFQASVFGRLSARMEYANGMQHNENSRYLLVHTRVGNQVKLARSFRFTQGAEELLRQGDMDRFVENCGTQFVYGSRTGGEFFALFAFELTSSEADRKFSASMQMAGIGWKGSGELQRALSQFQLQARTRISLYRMGGVGPLPEISDLSTFAKEYPQMVDTLRQHFVTLELITKDYTGVEPLTLRPNLQLMIRQEQVIHQLAQDRDQALAWLQQIRHIQQHPLEYEEAHFETMEAEISHYLAEVNAAAVNCFADVFHGCQLPSIPFPLVRLPRKRSLPSEQSESLKREKGDLSLFQSVSMQGHVRSVRHEETGAVGLELQVSHPYTNSLSCEGSIPFLAAGGAVRSQTWYARGLLVVPEKAFDTPWVISLSPPLGQGMLLAPRFSQSVELRCRGWDTKIPLPDSICRHPALWTGLQRACEWVPPGSLVPLLRNELYVGSCLCKTG